TSSQPTSDSKKWEDRAEGEEVLEEGELFPETVHMKYDSKEIPHNNTGALEEKDDPIDTNQRLSTNMMAPVKSGH
ncbi:hypothetical protein HAX54_022571, partial [Datura stramonium]|nr:hypothetical protein [Datura stramonium]